MRTDAQPAGGVDLVVGASAAAVAVGGVLWGAGAATAWLAGHRIPQGKPLAGYAAFADLGDPGRAWSAPVGSAILLLDDHILGSVAGRICVLGRVEALALRALRQEWRSGGGGWDGHPFAGAACRRRQGVAPTLREAAEIPAQAASRRCRLSAGPLDGGGLLGERGGFDAAFGTAALR